MDLINIEFNDKLFIKLNEIVRYHSSLYGINKNISDTVYLEIKQEMFTMINLFGLLDNSFEDKQINLLLEDILSLIIYFDKLNEQIKIEKSNDFVLRFKEIKSQIIPIINTKMYYLDLYVFNKVSSSRFLQSYIKQKFTHTINNSLEFISFGGESLIPIIDTNYKMININLFVKYESQYYKSIKELDQLIDRREDYLLRKLIDSRKAISFFKGMEPEDIKYVVKDVEFIKYKVNEMIIKKDEDTKEIYFLLSGNCKVIVDGNIVGRVDSNQLFGEFSSILNERRNATIIATQETTVIRFNFAFELFKQEPFPFSRLYKNIMNELIKKIVKLNYRR